MKGLLLRVYMAIQVSAEKLLTVHGKFSYVRAIAALIMFHGILHLSLLFIGVGLIVGLFCYFAEKAGNEMVNASPVTA